MFGAFVLFTGIKMLFVETEVHPEKNRVIKWVRKLYPVTPHLDGQKFVTTWQGRKALTPLALVLVMVETTDLIFALDSIPAIFAVTTKPFIVFTSNVFAILGLRSLYFVLAGALELFPLFEGRPVAGARLHRPQDAARPARQATRTGFKLKSPFRSLCWWSAESS